MILERDLGAFYAVGVLSKHACRFEVGLLLVRGRTAILGGWLSRII